MGMYRRDCGNSSLLNYASLGVSKEEVDAVRQRQFIGMIYQSSVKEFMVNNEENETQDLLVLAAAKVLPVVAIFVFVCSLVVVILVIGLLRGLMLFLFPTALVTFDRLIEHYDKRYSELDDSYYDFR